MGLKVYFCGANSHHKYVRMYMYVYSIFSCAYLLSSREILSILPDDEEHM